MQNITMRRTSKGVIVDKTGAPLKLTELALSTIIAKRALGHTWRSCAYAVSVSEETMRVWKRRGEEVRDEVSATLNGLPDDPTDANVQKVLDRYPVRDVRCYQLVTVAPKMRSDTEDQLITNIRTIADALTNPQALRANIALLERLERHEDHDPRKNDSTVTVKGDSVLVDALKELRRIRGEN